MARRRQAQQVSLGSISHGTMLASDLIPEFLSALEDYSPKRARDAQAEYRKSLALFNELGWDELEPETQEDLEYLLNEVLFEELDSLAPAFCYFGAHPGDGSDYGFWYSEDSRRDAVMDGEMWEVPNGDYPSEWKKYYASVAELFDAGFFHACHINDHGNCTVYAIKFRFGKLKANGHRDPVSVSFPEIFSVV